MTIAPHSRLLSVAAAWTAGTLLVVLWPVLWTVSVGTLAIGVALAIWDHALLRRGIRVDIMRHLPERAFVGRDATVAVEVSNSGAEAVQVEVVDEVPRDLRSEDPVLAAVTVTPDTPALLRYPVKPTRRGDRLFGLPVALVRSPFGFWQGTVVGRRGDVLRVYPDATIFLRPRALDPRRVFASIGIRPSRRRGEGMEFESLRDYVLGDDPRRVDWAASARRGRPVTRVLQHERNHTVLLALDTSRLMGSQVEQRAKLDYAVEAVVALAYAALVSGDRVGLVVFDYKVRGHVAPRAHRSALGAFVEILRPLEARLVEADYGALVRDLHVRQRHRSLVIVLTDFVEADAATVVAPLTVLGRRHRLLLVTVRDALYRTLDPGVSEGAADPDSLYRRLVLHDLLTEREGVLATLRRGGVQTVDLAPERITAVVLNRYLAIRYGPER